MPFPDKRHATRSGAAFVDWSAALNDVWIEKSYVESLQANTVAYKFARKSTIVENQGKVCRWLYVTAPSAITTAIAEGGDPADDTELTLNNVSATMDEYGGASEFTKFLQMTAISGTLEEIIDALGYQGAISVDTLLLTTLAGATTTQDAGVALTAEALKDAAEALDGNNCRRHPATPGAYGMIVSNGAGYDLASEGSPTYVEARSRDLLRAMKSPVGEDKIMEDVYSVKPYISTNVQTASGDDVMYVFAKDAFGASSLGARDVSRPEVIINRPSERRDIALRNRGTIGHWFLLGSEIIDNNRLVEVLADT